MLIKALILSLFFCFSVSANTEVYQYIDEQGNVVFTDKPVEGGHKREVKDPAVIKFKERPVPAVLKESETGRKQEKESPQQYTRLAIVKPEQDSSFQENTGTVAVSLAIQPELQLKFGHYVQVSLDGNWLPTKYASNSLTINNVNRGSHAIKVAVMDPSGMRLITSNTITFHLRQFSRRFR